GGTIDAPWAALRPRRVRNGLRTVHDAVASARAQSLRRPPLGSPAAPLGGRARIQRGVDRRASHGALGAAPGARSAGGPGAPSNLAHAHRAGRIPDAVPPPGRTRASRGDARSPRAGATELRR